MGKGHTCWTPQVWRAGAAEPSLETDPLKTTLGLEAALISRTHHGSFGGDFQGHLRVGPLCGVIIIRLIRVKFPSSEQKIPSPSRRRPPG